MLRQPLLRHVDQGPRCVCVWELSGGDQVGKVQVEQQLLLRVCVEGGLSLLASALEWSKCFRKSGIRGRGIFNPPVVLAVQRRKAPRQH